MIEKLTENQKIAKLAARWWREMIYGPLDSDILEKEDNVEANLIKFKKALRLIKKERAFEIDIENYLINELNQNNAYLLMTSGMFPTGVLFELMIKYMIPLDKFPGNFCMVVDNSGIKIFENNDQKTLYPNEESIIKSKK
jgi:hypothetical protein